MLPENIKGAIDRYVEHGIKPGSFTRAVLENDLRTAIAHADPVSFANLRDIMNYVAWDIPWECWGNQKKVVAWMQKKRSATTVST